MTGNWSKTSEKHSHFKIEFENGESIWFNDIRKFGSLKYCSEEELNKILNSLGWDPFHEPNKSWEDINWGRPNDAICQSLMDQSKFAGVGNYIKSEALYEAEVHPNTLIKNISDVQKEKITEAIKNVMNRSYAAGGNSLKDWKSVDGKLGKFSKELKVYGKKFDPAGKKVYKGKTKDGRTSWGVVDLKE